MEEVSTMRLTLCLLLAAEYSTVVVPFSAGSSRSFCGSSALQEECPIC